MLAILLGSSEWSSLWLRALMSLLLLIDSTCPLFGESSICEYNFPSDGSLSIFGGTTYRSLLSQNSRASKVLEGHRGCMYKLHTNRVRMVTSGHRSSFTQLMQKHQSLACCAKHPTDPSGLKDVCEGLHPQRWVLHTQSAHGGPGDTGCLGGVSPQNLPYCWHFAWISNH